MVQVAPKTSSFSDDDEPIYRNAFLRQLADKSGGKFFNAVSTDLSKSVNEIVSEISHTYSLAYYPSSPLQSNEAKKIKVELNNKKANLRYKQTYGGKIKK